MEGAYETAQVCGRCEITCVGAGLGLEIVTASRSEVLGVRWRWPTLRIRQYGKRVPNWSSVVALTVVKSRG